MKRMKKITAFLLMLVFAAACTGCSNHSAQQLEKVTFVLDWTPNTNHTGLYVADKLGYFKEEGIEVDVVSPPEDGAASLVAAGKADFGMDAQDTLAAAFASDSPLPVTAVASVIQHNTSGILSLREKGITSPRDMQGHSYATWGNPIEQAMIKTIVQENGGDFSRVSMVPTTVTDAVTALSTDIDTVWVYYAWDGIAAQVKGLDTDYFAFKDLHPEFDYYTPLIIAGDSFLQQKPETARRFLKALQKGYAYAAKHPKEAAGILCDAVPELDREIAEKSQEYLAGRYIDDAPYWGYIDADRWNAFYRWLDREKLTEHPLGDGRGFTNEYLAGDTDG